MFSSSPNSGPLSLYQFVGGVNVITPCLPQFEHSKKSICLSPLFAFPSE